MTAHWWTMIAVSYLFFAAGLVATLRGQKVTAFGLDAAANWIMMIADLIYLGGVARSVAVVPFVLAVWMTWWWWKGSRRGRDKAAKMLGEKSRALRDALVRRAREITVPRPVLAPQLYGRI